ncbi:oxidoreductase [Streptomyces sp. SPB78]|nr:oxidoreductase [Streptomyces sp. SPB78]
MGEKGDAAGRVKECHAERLSPPRLAKTIVRSRRARAGSGSSRPNVSCGSSTGLHGALARGAAERGGARVVAVSSTAHMRAGVDFDDLHHTRGPYDPQLAYARSKTANSLFAVAATRRWARDGIVANTVNPGGVATGLQRHFTQRQRRSLDAAEAAGVFTYKTVGQGAATTMVAAVLPALAHAGGRYLDDCQEAYTVPDDAALAEHPHGVKEWALDPALAERLWTVSAALTSAPLS